MTVSWNTTDGSSWFADVGSLRARVAAASGSGFAGFIYRSGGMIWSDTYSSISEAMQDLAKRVEELRFTREYTPPPAPGMGNIAPGYVLDKADVAAIEGLTNQLWN